MYVRDLKPLTRRFAVRYLARSATVTCRRCRRTWTTTRLNASEPRQFWALEGHRRRPLTVEALEAHAASAH